MIIHSVTPSAYILPSKNQKRVLFTSEKGSRSVNEQFMRVKNGVPSYYRRRDDEEDILFSTDPQAYI